jgi:hypothetical protein
MNAATMWLIKFSSTDWPGHFHINNAFASVKIAVKCSEVGVHKKPSERRHGLTA